MADRNPPNAVDDSFIDWVTQHVTLTANTNTPITFNIDVRAFRIKNWNTAATVLVKSVAQGAVSGGSDATASPIGFAPTASVPNVSWYPANGGNGVNLYSTGASVVTIEAWR